MIFAKVLTVIVAGVLTVLSLRAVIAGMQQAKARAQPQTPHQKNREVTRLHQDPVTGIYYPEN